jgi:hypothetical protein
MAETTHHGGCHCGAVRYKVELDLAQPATACNCSICGRSGTLLAFVPAAKFTLEKGEASLQPYKFNKQHIDHQFCKVCGIKSFARGKSDKGEMVAINVRTIDGIDPFAAAAGAKQFDGAKL